LLRSKQQANGTSLSKNTHSEIHFELEDGDKQPSRWNRLRALRGIASSIARGYCKTTVFEKPLLSDT